MRRCFTSRCPERRITIPAIFMAGTRAALPESCRPYVLDYGAILPCAVQPFALLISSYGDKMKLSVAQRDHDMQVVEDLCAGLRQLGIQPETLSYPFVVTRYNGLECGM